MSTPETKMSCPSDETIAAFIDGRLQPEDCQRVIDHMVTCADCYSIISAASDMAATESETTVSVTAGRSPARTIWASAAAALAAAIAVVFLYAPVHDRLFRQPSGIEALVEASAALPDRPSDARLSADFPHREAQRTMRGDKDPLDSLENVQLLAAVAQIKKTAHKEPSVPNLHALGVSYLLLGKPREAIETLEGAVKKETGEVDIVKAIGRSTNAPLLNDLAASYQAVMQKKGDLTAQPLAVEAAQRAWSLAKTPQIAWTRAVVIASLHIPERAIAAWRDYLALDPSSEWSTEARKNLNELMEPTDADLWPAARDRLAGAAMQDRELDATIDRFRQNVRLWCEDELLPSWGDAVLRDDSSAAERMSQIETIGTALERVNGEFDVHNAVQAIRSADPAQLQELARGHVAYGAGRRAMLNLAADEAMRQMTIAIASMPRTPFVWRARAEHAAAVYMSNDYLRALDLVNTLVDHKQAASTAFRGRVHAARGMLRLQTGSPKLAIDDFLTALDATERSGESDYEAALHTRLAAALEVVGRYEDAFAHQAAALRLLERTGNARRQHEVIFEAAYSAIEKDQPALADLLLDTVVSHDVQMRDSVKACTSLMWRSAYRFRRDMRDGARRDLADARAFCRSIGDPAARERALANLGIAEASLRSDETIRDEVERLDAAVAYYQKTDSRHWLRTAFFVRARASEARGDVVSAERDYVAALAETASTRGRINEPETRMSFTATADEITDGYVDFLLQRHRERDAFEVADRSRVRELVDAPNAHWRSKSDRSDLAAIQAALPPGASIVEYRVLGQAIKTWVVSSQTFSAADLPVPITRINGALAGLEQHASATQFRESTTALYDALIAPLNEFLKTSGTIIIVPDDELERVPYSALYDRVAGRYLCETRSILVAPSAALFFESMARFANRTTGNERVVIVEAGSPNAQFDALPGAAKESQAVAALFQDARVISASEATSAGVMKAAADATLLHFAGHASSSVEQSTRILRLGDEDSARLSVADIRTAALPHLRIAFLSACDTDAGPILKSEGSVTIARSFFAAGVPVVVATLWPVDDSTARQVATMFYQRMHAGAAPAEALRDAQRTLLSRNPDSPADWAAFRVIGAGIRFENHGS